MEPAEPGHRDPALAPRRVDLDLDLRIDAPFGPVRVRSEERAVVIGAGGVVSTLRMIVWALRNRGSELNAALRVLTRISNRRVVLDLPLLFRLTVARP